MTDSACNKPPEGAVLSKQALELLEEHHDFPGPYMFKVIGFAAGGFSRKVAQAAKRALADLDEDCIRERPSSGGKYVSVTLDVEVADARQVLEVYAELQGLEGLVALI